MCKHCCPCRNLLFNESDVCMFLVHETGQGEAPIIMYGPDCADGTGFPPISANRLGDYPRAAIARPADPSSPYLYGLSIAIEIWMNATPPNFTVMNAFKREHTKAILGASIIA